MNEINKNAKKGDILSDWEIDEETAKKVMKHRFSEGNNMSNIIDHNNKFRTESMIERNNEKKEGNWEEARYKDKQDVIKYCENRSIPYEPNNNSSAGNVIDYKTKIFKVKVIKTGFEDTVTYYDLATIKPPPHDTTAADLPSDI